MEAGETLALEHHVRAAESFDMPAVGRVGSHQPGEILRALDVGAARIVVPHVNPPIGRRGPATTTRAGRHAFSNLKEHLRSAQENKLIAVQVEDPEALENLEGIASVLYIDCISAPPTSRLA